jgi:hypothetical protein
MSYEGAWLYHGLYHYTRDGLRSGLDALNTVSSCDDPTLGTFLDYFDPIQYAPTQHAPLLTILGSHDQYFTVPAINTTFDRVASAGSAPDFEKRLLLVPNGEHTVLNGSDDLGTILALFGTISAWFRYGFDGDLDPPRTPSVELSMLGSRMVFKVTANPGSRSILRARLNVASQIDTTPELPCDFQSVRLYRYGNDFYGFVRAGKNMPCGPPLTPDNVLYFASITDLSGYTVSSRIYRGDERMTFGTGFSPTIEHWHDDDLPVPPPPTCPATP